MKDNISLWRKFRYWWHRRRAVLITFTVVNDNTAHIKFGGPGMMKLEIYTRTGKITKLPYVLSGDQVELTFGQSAKPDLEKMPCVGDTIAYRSDWTEQETSQDETETGVTR
jgi:hypothetical protein